jgi:hypothetical protein
VTADGQFDLGLDNRACRGRGGLVHRDLRDRLVAIGIGMDQVG